MKLYENIFNHINCVQSTVDYIEAWALVRDEEYKEKQLNFAYSRFNKFNKKKLTSEEISLQIKEGLKIFDYEMDDDETDDYKILEIDITIWFADGSWSTYDTLECCYELVWTHHKRPDSDYLDIYEED